MKKIIYLALGIGLVTLGVFKAMDWYTGMSNDIEGKKISSTDKMGIVVDDPSQPDKKRKTPAPTTPGTPTPPPAPVSNIFVCDHEINAYNTSNPSQILGLFKKGTTLTLGTTDANSGKIHVTFQPPGGKEIRALCLAKDVGR